MGDQAVYGVGLKPLDCWITGSNPVEGMDILLFFVVCFLGNALCDELRTCSEASYRVCLYLGAN